jgi:hypothetical protein
MWLTMKSMIKSNSLPIRFDIPPGAECRIHFVVGQWCKSTVRGRRVKRQQVNTADGLAEVTPQYVMQLDKVTAQAVRVDNQLYLILQGHF